MEDMILQYIRSDCSRVACRLTLKFGYKHPVCCIRREANLSIPMTRRWWRLSEFHYKRGKTLFCVSRDEKLFNVLHSSKSFFLNIYLDRKGKKKNHHFTTIIMYKVRLSGRWDESLSEWVGVEYKSGWKRRREKKIQWILIRKAEKTIFLIQRCKKVMHLWHTWNWL